MTRLSQVLVGGCFAALLAPADASAQLFTLTREQLIELSAQNPFDRFPDGRPKVPDEAIERAKGLSAEDVWVGAAGQGIQNQYEDGFQILHPGTKLVGRAFTVQFMPVRPDIEEVLQANAKKAGLAAPVESVRHRPCCSPVTCSSWICSARKRAGRSSATTCSTTSCRPPRALASSSTDPCGIWRAFRRCRCRRTSVTSHPTPIGNVMLTAVNVPVRIGNVTVMPGDLVFGDREGVYFIPPALVNDVLDKADETHIHDEWTKKKFAEGKYKSSEIYGSPKDPALKKEYEEYLKKRLEEIRKK